MMFTKSELRKILSIPENRELFSRVKSGELKDGRLRYDSHSNRLTWSPVKLRDHGKMITILPGGRRYSLSLCTCCN